MKLKLPVKHVLNSTVPISRFNKGEANKIFNEVKETGCKIVIKNNKPAFVLLTSEAYEDMIELIEDYELMIEAEKRIRDEKNMKTYSMEEVMKMYGITQEELDAMPDVEIE